MTCRACAAELPEGARFCPACGSPAALGSIPPREERRLLTVLFADLVGFTAASDGADPEDIRARTRPFHALVREEAARTGGTVARVVGDGVMIVWGYPRARDDDAVRALRTALAIRDGVQVIPGAPQVRVGVNSGEAVVTIGSRDERADDAMGDAVNVAARLAAAAPPGGVLAGATTAQLAGSALDADPLALGLKGKSELVAAVLVRSVGRFAEREASAPFRGRNLELQAIEALRPTNGRLAVERLLITGDPGIGKSRLVAELRSRTPGVAWYVGRCRDGGAPGEALGEVVKRWAGVTDEDPASVSLDRLRETLPGDRPDASWLLDRLAPLVGAQPPGSTPAGPDRPFVPNEERRAAWAVFLGLLAMHGPAAVLFEDLHWADPELVGLFAGPEVGMVEAPLLVIATARPEALGTFPLLRDVERLELEPLDPATSLEIVRSIGPGLSVHEAQALVDRAAGNPLFLGELMRLGSTGGTPLPATLQAVFDARFDHLDPVAREVVRDAAVVGEAFWRGALVATGALDARGPDAVDAALVQLTTAGIVRPAPSTALNDEAYVFGHALLRDAAYRSLVRPDRGRRHLAFADWLETTAGVGRPDLADPIATHLLAALDVADSAGLDAGLIASRARATLLRAAGHAMTVDPTAAVERYGRALDLAPDEEGRLETLRAMAIAQLASGAYADASRTVDVGLAIATGLGDLEALADLRIVRGRAGRYTGDPTWETQAPAVIALLEPAGPSRLLMEAYMLANFREFTEGSSTLADAWATKAIEAAAALGVPPPAEGLSRRAFGRAMRGDPHAVAEGMRAADVARDAGDSRGLAVALSDLGGIHVYLGDMAAAERCFRDSLEVARTRGLRGMVTEELLNTGYAQRIRGSVDDALATLAEARALAEQGQNPRHAVSAAFERCLALESIGDVRGLRVERAAMPDVSILGSLALHLRGVLDAVDAGVAGNPEAFRAAAAQLELPATADDAAEELDVHFVAGYLPVARAGVRVGVGDPVRRLAQGIPVACAAGRAIRTALEGYGALAGGDTATGVGLLTSAVEQLHRMGWTVEASRGREVLSTLR